ncbi:hypothetical protein L210DRAFT_3610469 [Boletus edulis BED1]|uniref:Uncharacterized protein n=1 Tax=Boletus edulis BED1 TaxID=1328754 RepID=A0AAD4GII7_BOLED|nr:hypothetical protein L210DRAFT_3610469 [Boletus edulis BED1]
MRPSILPSFLYFALYFSVALSFSVTVGSPPTQCGSLNVTWTGGQAPFQIMLIPVYNIPRNISVPSTAFSNNQGSYQISPIPFTSGKQFFVTMSDATGFGTGGISELLTVGEPVNGASCNTTNPTLAYSFSLPSSLQQCSSYVFNGYDGAVLPVTITGFIPGGNVFFLHPPSTGTSYTWLADVAAGTTIVFSMTDAHGISGGSSDTQLVSLSDIASCLNPTSPSSTITTIPSSTHVGSSTSSPSQPSTSSGVSKGTIAGAVFGALLAATAVVALAVFCLKRQRHGRSPYGFATSRTRVVRIRLNSILETSSTSPSVYLSEAPHTLQQHSRSNSNTDSFPAFGGRRKAAMAGIPTYQHSTRFIVHTDAEDVPAGEAEVVELPPQYSERRIPGERPTSSVTALSSTNLAYLSGPHADGPPHSTPHPPLE